ncbi:hypothetical protein P153DRAFT_359087 [Dothidotthia symphoricarpi CBS 119687]|uniref:Protein kinase domain-containing protein n=1 Tax=Dothidotthia symphoricarpi CBS 119687 TaxID=1392245 RepID=A0A6A6A4K1_9PLEO|nr:uncharacterized protein P153DRAFT_359087 [Dothidotthia symphoricarpi CBS 119687]KAF2126730.1 hypothetical protein P153DRAFT_359087 [Dothidotthia symphoricarpi CBS 119687]
MADATGLGPLKTARGYYERAWRQELKRIHPHWTAATIRKNLKWLWDSRTQAEEDACQLLVDNGASAHPVIDVNIAPHSSVEDNMPPDARAAFWSTWAAQAGVAPVVLPAVLPAPAPVPAPVLPVQPLNSSVTFLPAIPHMTELPKFPTERDEHADWVAHDPSDLISFPDSTPADRWQGARMLGRGAKGVVGLFVKLDEHDNIVDRVAIKDTAKDPPEVWFDLIRWRDRLPMDIAILERLETQGAHLNILAYRGYRLSTIQQRYRLYNAVCDYGCLMDALEFYSAPWRRRRNTHRKMEFDTIFGTDEAKRLAAAAYEFASPFDSVAAAQKALATEDLWGDGEVDDWKKGPFALPTEVIPEAFLWEVFRCLVEACSYLESGAGVDLGPGKDWRPILHADLHLQNVFVMPPEPDTGERVDEDMASPGEEGDGEDGRKTYVDGPEPSSRTSTERNSTSKAQATTTKTTHGTTSPTTAPRT